MNNLSAILSVQVFRQLEMMLSKVGQDKWGYYPHHKCQTENYWELKAIVVLKKYGILEIKQVEKKRFIKLNSDIIEKTNNLIK